jgi:hypothetical protein
MSLLDRRKWLGWNHLVSPRFLKYADAIPNLRAAQWDVRRLRNRTVKWTLYVPLMVVGLFAIGCDRQAQPPPKSPPDIIKVLVRVIRARDPNHGLVLVAPTLTTESGKQATYDIGEVRLVVQSTSNGDKTITIRAIFYEDANTNTPDIIACPDTTVADGETATNQISIYSFEFSPKIITKEP